MDGITLEQVAQASFLGRRTRIRSAVAPITKRMAPVVVRKWWLYNGATRSRFKLLYLIK